MKSILSAAIGFVCIGTVASANIDMETVVYVCEGGEIIHATYIDTDQASAVVLNIAGQQVALHDAISGSGVRYAVPDGQKGYDWHTKGDDAVLSLYSATNDEILARECQVQ